MTVKTRAPGLRFIGSISAITNYTTTLLEASSSDSEKLDAMRFVIHFVRDSHQPLHDEAIDVGGNTIEVTHSTELTNLHQIWDTEMVELLVGWIGAVESGDLSTAYFNAHYDVARVQIARAGYCLGAWLDLIAAAASA